MFATATTLFVTHPSNTSHYSCNAKPFKIINPLCWKKITNLNRQLLFSYIKPQIKKKHNKIFYLFGHNKLFSVQQKYVMYIICFFKKVTMNNNDPVNENFKNPKKTLINLHTDTIRSNNNKKKEYAFNNNHFMYLI